MSAQPLPAGVTLEITAGVPHVFQTFHSVLDEATAALDRAGQLLSAHLARRARHRITKGRTIIQRREQQCEQQ
jgi:hypothetical protein